MNSLFWQPSEQQKKTILLLDVVGLLHDLGKLSNGFIKRVAKDRPHNFLYDYELLADPNVVFPPAPQILGRINKMQEYAKKVDRSAPFKDHPPLTEYLQIYSLQGWDRQSYNLAELLLLTAPKDVKVDWLQILRKSLEPAKLVGKLHGIAHYEKQAADQDQKQPYSFTYTASPFGVEHHIPVDKGGADLTASLVSLPLQEIAKILSNERREWLAAVKEHLTKGIAETQRPTNEVSL